MQIQVAISTIKIKSSCCFYDIKIPKANIESENIMQNVYIKKKFELETFSDISDIFLNKLAFNFTFYKYVCSKMCFLCVHVSSSREILKKLLYKKK